MPKYIPPERLSPYPEPPPRPVPQPWEEELVWWPSHNAWRPKPKSEVEYRWSRKAA